MKSDKNDKDTRTRVSFILNVLVPILTLFVLPFTVPNLYVATPIFLVILGILCGALLFQHRKPILESKELILRRWEGIDSRRRGLVKKVSSILLGPPLRALYRVFHNPVFWVGIYGFLVGAAFWGLHFVFYPASNPAPTSYSLLWFTATVGPVTAIVSLTYILFRRWEKDRERKDPHHLVTRQIERVIQGYSRAIPAKTLRRLVAVQDPGPIYVVSAAAHDFLSPFSDSSEANAETVFEAAWRTDNDKRFRVLLTDPTCDLIRKRNARLNDRYIEYYVAPYLGILFLWYKERIAGTNRIDLRFHKELDYRCILSRNRLALQRYAQFRHGWKEEPILLHRVHFSGTLESELRALNKCDHNDKYCVLNRWETIASDSAMFSREHDSIFEYYRDSIERMFSGAHVETFLNEWESHRLRDLGRLCDIGREKMDPFWNDKAGLAKLICEELELSAEYNDVVSLAGRGTRGTRSGLAWNPGRQA